MGPRLAQLRRNMARGQALGAAARGALGVALFLGASWLHEGCRGVAQSGQGECWIVTLGLICAGVFVALVLREDEVARREQPVKKARADV